MEIFNFLLEILSVYSVAGGLILLIISNSKKGGKDIFSDVNQSF